MVLRDLRACAEGEELAVDHPAADEPDLGIVRDHGERLVDAMCDVDALARKAMVSRDDDVAATLERLSSREALEGLAAHEDGVTLRVAHEVAHVRAVVHKHAAADADAPVVADGNDGV